MATQREREGQREKERKRAGEKKKKKKKKKKKVENIGCDNTVLLSNTFWVLLRNIYLPNIFMLRLRLHSCHIEFK